MSDFDLFDIRHLKFFAAIAEEGNLTAAAIRLNTTQSNLSTQIKQLEDVLGTGLLEREYDGVSLTAGGHVLLAGAYEALQLWQDIMDMLRGLDAIATEPLRLGFFSLIEQSLLSGACDRIQALIPGTQVKTVTDGIDSLEQRVRDGGLHGALVTLPLGDDRDIESVLIDRDPFVVCIRADDPLAIHETLPAHTLTGKLAIFEYAALHPFAYKRLLELLREVGIEPLDLHPTVNFEHVQWMVMQRECYALIRSNKKLIAGLTARPVHGVSWTADSALIAPVKNQHPAMTLLMRENARKDRQSATQDCGKQAQPPRQRSRKSSKNGQRKSNVTMRLF